MRLEQTPSGSTVPRRLVVSAYVSADGVSEDPVGMEDTGLGNWTGGVTRGPRGDAIVHEELFRSDIVLLGRRTYDGFAAVWPAVTDETGFAARINRMRKVVASTTLERADWNNTTVSRDATTDVAALKSEGGGDILVYGSARLAGDLFRSGLVDEVHLMMYPTVLGRGGRLLPAEWASRMHLVGVEQLGDGILDIRYRIARDGAG